MNGATKKNCSGTSDERHSHAACFRSGVSRCRPARIWVGCITFSGGHSLNVLKQMARYQGSRHAKCYFVRTILCDALTGMKEEYAWPRSDGSQKETAVQGALLV